MQSDQPREPVLNAPAIVVGTIILMVLVHAGLGLIAPSAQSYWILTLAFIPARYGAAAAAVPGDFTIPGDPWSAWTSLLTHMFVHADWLHLGINSAWMLAFGTIIARRMSALRFAGLFLVCGLGGVGLFYAINAGAFAPMVGASGAVSGLMGGVFRFLFHARQYGGFAGAHRAPRNVPLMTLAEALTNGRVVVALAIWIGLNLLFATDVSSVVAEGQIAWEAHLGGFLAGFLLIGLFDQVGRAPPPGRAAGPWSHLDEAFRDN